MTQYTRRASMAPRPLGRSAGLRQALTELVELIRIWRHRSRSRQHLSDLPPHLLRDIGVTQDEAHRESGKPFWR
ncbi:MAG: DUF1127 domain-containing protein [Pseudomonadota bacterium]